MFLSKLFTKKETVLKEDFEKLQTLVQNLQNQTAVALSEKEKFSGILSSIIDGIIALDFNKNIIFLNKASEELLGCQEAEVKGKSIDGILNLFSEQDQIFSKAYCQGSFNQTAKLISRGGKETKVNLITAQVGGDTQSSLSCILIMHDLSKEEELEQMKLDFVSMASHELKTPLTSIIGYLSVYLNENRQKVPKENLVLLDKAFIATQQLQTLIQNLLNVNKIEKEQLSVSLEPVDFRTLLSKSIEDLKPQANQKEILLSLSAPQTLPTVMGDTIRLSEVVTNLTANAINYTNPGGKVDILVEVMPAEIRTSVIDNGVGIPQEAIPHLFGKFFRVSNSLQKSSKGTGLGLYISKSIIEKLRGKIWVESEVGKGSKFTFTLPLSTHTAGVIDQNKFVSSAIQAGSLNY